MKYNRYVLWCDALTVAVEGSIWSVGGKEEPPSKACTRIMLYISSLISLRSSFLALRFQRKVCVQYPSCLPAWQWGLCSVSFLSSCVALGSLNMEEVFQSLLPVLNDIGKLK